MEKIKRWFEFENRQTNLRTEIIAGVTTFLSTLYIVVVNPTLFSRGGMDFGDVYLATILATITATLVMGIAANYPIVVAPGIGINAYLVYSVIIAEGTPWQEALGASLLASGLLILVSLSSLRQMLIQAIPPSLKAAISVGIGLFIAVIGLENGRLLVSSPATVLTLGDLADPMAALTVLGLFLTMGLMALRVTGAIFISMLLIAVTAYFEGLMDVPSSFFALPGGLSQTFWQFSFANMGNLTATIFILFLVTLFDTTGTMLAVGRQAGLVKGETFPHLKSVLLADAFGGFVGAALGTGPASAFVESGSGVAAGGRTGFAAVVTAGLFALLTFCAPLARMIASVPAITAPALILVGAFMMESVAEIDWRDYTEAFPAFFTLLFMPVSFSIASGVGLGFILYVFLKMVTGRRQSVHPLMYVLSVLFAIQMAVGIH